MTKLLALVCMYKTQPLVHYTYILYYIAICNHSIDEIEEEGAQDCEMLFCLSHSTIQQRYGERVQGETSFQRK